jgi:hypothetical protein
MLVDFKGQALLDQPPGSSFVETSTLSASALHQFRKAFPAWQDADAFELTGL